MTEQMVLITPEEYSHKKYVERLDAFIRNIETNSSWL